jgi:hypothetical protein
MNLNKSSSHFDVDNGPFAVKSVNIRTRSASIRPGDILQNEAFKSQPADQKFGYKLTWLRSRTGKSSEKMSQTVVTRRKKETRKKHFLTSPFGVILKGKKLVQRYGIGSIFREKLEFNPKNAIFRDHFNMRSKWK